MLVPEPPSGDPLWEKPLQADSEVEGEATEGYPSSTVTRASSPLTPTAPHPGNPPCGIPPTPPNLERGDLLVLPGMVAVLVRRRWRSLAEECSLFDPLGLSAPIRISFASPESPPITRIPLDLHLSVAAAEIAAPFPLRFSPLLREPRPLRVTAGSGCSPRRRSRDRGGRC